MLYLQTTITGILASGVLALIAIGFSMQWRVLKVVNLSHFGIVLVSAYVSYHLARMLQADPLLLIVIPIVVGALMTMGLQWIFDRFRVDPSNSLLLTFGILIMLGGGITTIWGADPRTVPANLSPYATMSVAIGSISLPVATLIAFGIASAVTIAGTIFLHKGYFGRALRVIAHDKDIGIAFGVEYRRTAMLLAIGNGAIAGLAGSLVSISGSIYPDQSEAWIGLVFAIVILGGIGSVLGSLVAAVLVSGIVGLGSAIWSTSTATLIMFVLLIAMLLWRTEGLFRRLRI